MKDLHTDEFRADAISEPPHHRGAEVKMGCQNAKLLLGGS